MQRRLRQEPGIRRVFSVLLEASCEPVILKGVALAYSRYARPEFRSFADLDVLLPPAQLERAYDALVAAGFESNADVPHQAGHQHLPPLFAPQREIVVELHRTLFEEQSPFNIRIDRWMDRAEPATILGHQVRMLSPTDSLLHVAAHLSYSHRYERHPLRSLSDILALVHHDDVNWHEFTARARASRMDGAVVWPLAAARAWLGAPIPARVFRELMPPRPLRRLVGAAVGSGYILDRQAVSADGTAVAYDRLLELSILGRGSTREQGRVLFSGLFPSKNYIPRLANSAPTSATRRTVHLLHPTRLSRGVKAVAKLIAFQFS
jgi:hypothetical protein